MLDIPTLTNGGVVALVLALVALVVAMALTATLPTEPDTAEVVSDEWEDALVDVETATDTIMAARRREAGESR